MVAGQETLRILQDGTLVVPPFECAWLTGEAYELRQGSGCVLFDAKAETDVTLILKPTPGTKRLQPLQRADNASAAAAGGAGPLGMAVRPVGVGQPQQLALAATPSSTSGLVGLVEPNYTVILGSHRNSCLKIERNGSTVSMVQGVAGANVSSREFVSFWVDLHQGLVTVGWGEVCPENISHQWQDTEPLPDLFSVGLSCWDRHVSYRNIQVLPTHRFQLQSAPQHPHPLTPPPPPLLPPSAAASAKHLAAPASGEGFGKGFGEGLGGAAVARGLWGKSVLAVPVKLPSLFSLCTQVLVSHLGDPRAAPCAVAQLAELLLPNTRTLYRACLEYLARNFKQVVGIPATLASTSDATAALARATTNSTQTDASSTNHPAATTPPLAPPVPALVNGAAANAATATVGAPQAVAIAASVAALVPSAVLPPPSPSSRPSATTPTALAAQWASDEGPAGDHVADDRSGNSLLGPSAAYLRATSAAGAAAPGPAPTPMASLLQDCLPGRPTDPQPPTLERPPSSPAERQPCPAACALLPQRAQHASFEQLPTTLLCDLLLQNAIAVSEKQIFDAVVRWACYGGTPTALASTCALSAEAALAAAPGNPAATGDDAKLLPPQHQRLLQQRPGTSAAIPILATSADAGGLLAGRRSEVGLGALAPLAQHSRVGSPEAAACVQSMSPSRDSQRHVCQPSRTSPGAALPQSPLQHEGKGNGAAGAGRAIGATSLPVLPQHQPPQRQQAPLPGALPPGSATEAEEVGRVVLPLLTLAGATPAAVATAAGAGPLLGPRVLDPSEEPEEGPLLHGAGSGAALSRSSVRSMGEARSSADVCCALSLIRYCLMTTQELEEVLRHPLVVSQPSLQALVHEAMGLDVHRAGSDADGTAAADLARVSGGRGVVGPFTVENKRLLHSLDSGRMSAARFQRRLLPETHECAYVCDGDQNGVLHFIGTLYNTQAWVNPVLARRVDVRASSPSGRHTDPKVLASSTFVRTNWAGPKYVNGQPDTWWLVDLGDAHTLLVTYYTMRHDGSTDYVRSWALQGSTDLVTWTELQRHSKDPCFRQPGQYCSWPVLGPLAQTPYRAFRLVLTGPTASAHQPHHFPLAHLELYGYLTRTTPQLPQPPQG